MNWYRSKSYQDILFKRRGFCLLRILKLIRDSCGRWLLTIPFWTAMRLHQIIFLICLLCVCVWPFARAVMLFCLDKLTLFKSFRWSSHCQTNNVWISISYRRHHTIYMCQAWIIFKYEALTAADHIHWYNLMQNYGNVPMCLHPSNFA